MIPLEMLEALVAVADHRHVSRHQAIREAIADYIAKHSPPG